MDFSKTAWRVMLGLGVVGAVLVALKLLGAIGTSWWLVLLPFAPLAIIPLMLVFAILVWASDGGH